MMAAIETVDNYHWGNDKIAVLGEMGELGENEVKHHKEVLKKALDLDLLILVGQKWYPAVSSLSESAKSRIIFADKRDLLNTIRSQISRGNIILIKGSHSNRLDQIVAELVESK
jgi:UDP-N-acetylmuramoyl-tripeptide--D-alanyl-D-alanine ligase